MANAGRPDQGLTTDRLRGLRAALERLRKRQPFGYRLTGGLAHGVLAAASAVLAYVPTQILGLREGFWAAITALAVTQTEFGATRSTARDQFTGAALGGAVGLAMLLAFGQGLTVYGAAIVISVLTASALNVASAARLAGITATIILIVPHQGSAERMMLSRVFEVGWGVLVAVLVVWAGTRLARPVEPGG